MQHVLAIDDDEIHCYALVKTLQAAGFRVSHAHDGTTAIRLAKDELPGVILLDINLPDVNGYEVCARIKNDPVTANIPVIFHTATEATSLAKSHAELVGAAAFLTYPIDHDHLVAVVRGAVSRAAAAPKKDAASGPKANS